MRQVIEDGRVDAVVIFATSRLFRKTYRALQFVHEGIVERDIRCVFVKSCIDTADKNDWETRLHVQSLVDEFQTRTAKSHIRAEHSGLLLKGRVFGTLSYGYRGEEIPGETTRSSRPARMIAIDPDTSPWVAMCWPGPHNLDGVDRIIIGHPSALDCLGSACIWGEWEAEKGGWIKGPSGLSPCGLQAKSGHCYHSNIWKYRVKVNFMHFSFSLNIGFTERRYNPALA